METSDNRSNETTSTLASHYVRYANLGSFAGAGKPSKQRVLQVLFKLYSEKDTWRSFGGLRTCCRNCMVIAPVELWWWMSEIFVLVTVFAFTYEFFFLNWLAVVPAIVVAVLEWMAFYKTCLKDPGVMQRPDFVTAFRNLVKVLVSWADGASLNRYVVRAGGANEQLNFCWKCNHYRAITTTHCGICDCCMMQHDHHCPVFGGCVAKNNTSSFHTMVVSMGGFWMYSLGYCMYNMATSTETFVRRSNATSYTDSDFNSAARITFYLIMAEIGAVIIIPGLVTIIKKLKKRNEHTQTAPHSNKKMRQLTEEVLQFARENHFPIEEEVQLRDILQLQHQPQSGGNTISQRNDLNHNAYYPVS